jgi:hypothetical protein
VYQNYFIPLDSVQIPEAYIIGNQWTSVIDLLRLNKINFKPFKKDTIIYVKYYKIASYETVNNPYEGHYLHYNTQTNTTINQLKVYAGDILVSTNQPGFRYLLETLNPRDVYSLINRNFFDTILQQKEGFSPYVFEDASLALLQNDSVLRNKFNTKKQAEKEFSQNWYAQLNCLFKRSKHYEEAHMKYPVFRILKSE